MASLGSSPVIAIVAGETSGDILGAGLIRALRRFYPAARFIGVCGPLMEEEGGESLFPMEQLAVMGITEIIPKLPELFRLRRQLVEHIAAANPVVCITIDSPDFTLGVAARLHQQGIKTVHYVSPSVWAWRKGRLKTIKANIDHMLALLPFEEQIYQKEGVPVTFVGHPLADTIALHTDKAQARAELGLEQTGKVLGVLPGSRGGEVRRLLPDFLAAVKLLQKKYTELAIIIPAANPLRKKEITAGVESMGLTNVRVTDGESRKVMAAADVLLMASGTATLEGALFKKPMVVGYRLGPITYFIMSLLLNIKYVALPNLLCNEELVPELIQHKMTPEALAEAVTNWFEQPQRVEALADRLQSLHVQLRRGASARAAEAVRQLIEK
ncbi:MAG TPA: lipid-A-disaccharide synthase [Alcanivoracaceae bacterium]|nr:lipid-A-disaccharide synthase [Alcanivoracaceae bacterium]